MSEQIIISEERLRMLLANGMPEVAQQLIDTHKLPYRIEEGELKDALVGCDLWLKAFITQDSDTIALKDDVRKLAKIDDEVLITGETGTGKEIIAHSLMGNRAGKFVVANCAGFPEQLIESELFGYVKGSFTGADGTRQGLFASAADGVMFLDEIGELPLSMQAKLLRALQEKKIRRVGGRDEEAINCKFVCATHRNIKTMVEQGTFRRDLYARISTFELHIKPLRERDKDVIPILEHMKGGRQFVTELQKRGLMHKLDLSLNVRSLQQYLKRYNVLGKIVV